MQTGHHTDCTAHAMHARIHMHYVNNAWVLKGFTLPQLAYFNLICTCLLLHFPLPTLIWLYLLIMPAISTMQLSQCRLLQYMYMRSPDYSSEQ